MGVNALLLFIVFSSLTIIGLMNDELRQSSLKRTQHEWTADIVGLFIQGVMIPSFPFLMVPLLDLLFPSLARSIDVDPVLQFMVSFVLFDYAYYWNHRLFHKPRVWYLHRLHHSSRHLDVFATSRNSLLTSFFFVYVWGQILGMFFLSESFGFMLGLGLTFALDLWRHSGVSQPQFLHQLFGWALVFPEQHVLHHSVHGRRKNYGANLIWWDKLHGTFSDETIPNKNLERPPEKNVWRELLSPWKAMK